MVFNGPMTRQMLLAYVEHCLVLALKRNDIVGCHPDGNFQMDVKGQRVWHCISCPAGTLGARLAVEGGASRGAAARPGLSPRDHQRRSSRSALSGVLARSGYRS
jgi:hypothetical protein